MVKKIALVTGASRGIGRAVSEKLAQNGYTVCINYTKSKELAEELANQINGFAICADVADKLQVKSMIFEIISKFGKIDLLVNNAGVSRIDLFDAIPDEFSKNILNTNLGGTLNCSRAVLPYMLSKKSGNIVNISSMWGEVGASCEVDYSASKAGIIGFTKALAKEVGLSGIRVNCVSPGVILTDMNLKTLSEDDLNALKEETPLGTLGSPDDVAEAVYFFASEKSKFITGQILGVNGGFII